jgi:membrane protein
VFGGIKGAFTRFYGNDGFFLAAGLSFAFLICLIPLTLLSVSLVGFIVSSQEAAQEVVGQLARNFPVYKAEISRALLRIVETRRASGLIGTAVLVASSTSLFGAARLVLHRMLGFRTGGNLVRNLLRDTLMVLLLSVLLFFATAVAWAVQWFEQFVVEPSDPSGLWVERVSLGFSMILATIIFFFAFFYVPQRRVRAGAALSGAVLASVLWEIAKQLFRLYIRRVGFYDQIYGPLAVLFAFVMFVYYSAVVFVFSAAWVAALDARRR